MMAQYNNPNAADGRVRRGTLMDEWRQLPVDSVPQSPHNELTEFGHAGSK
jgi:hypothetical protein